MAAISTAQSGNWNVGATWVGGTPPTAGDDVTILNTHTVTQTQNEQCATIAINSGGELDISTFDQAMSSAMTVDGTLTMGTSASNGLTVNGFTANSGSTVDLQNLSKIVHSGNVLIHNSKKQNCEN